MDYDKRWQRRFETSQMHLELKERAIIHMGGCCQICGYDKCPQAMAFHHEDPQEKSFEISSLQNWARIVQELRKCILVCCNCHAEIHAGWHPQFLVSEDTDRYYDPFENADRYYDPFKDDLRNTVPDLDPETERVERKVLLPEPRLSKDPEPEKS